MQGVFGCVCAAAPCGISPAGTDPAALELPPLPAATNGSSATLTKTLSKFILS